MQVTLRIKNNYRAGSILIKMRTLCVLYCLLYATLTKGAEINVEGFEGKGVSFSCSHRLAWNYAKYLCNPPCKSSEDKLVTVKPGGRAKLGRITLLDAGDGSFTVTFSQLQLSDSKGYLCGVERPGLDTYTSVQLTVKKAVANGTAVMPDVSPTSTYKNVTNSIQLTTEVAIIGPTNISTASNVTNGIEQNNRFWTGTILSATVGGVAVIIILMLATCCRKHKEISKPQPRVCSNSRDVSDAHESEVNCEYDDIGSVVQCVKTLPESTSVSAHRPKQNPPTSGSTAGKCSRPVPIYENISFSRGAAGSNAQNNPGITSGIYIKPLPPITSERPADWCPGKHTKPRSVWFGLDLTGINQS